MISKILVTTDFSKCGNSALSYAFEMARKMKAEVTVLNVIEREHHESHYFIDMKPLDSEENSKKARKKAKEDLKELLTDEITSGVDLEIKVEIDRRAEDGIIHACENMKPDLLIMSSHGYSGFKKLLIGSSTDRVVRSVDCPVLIIKANCE